MNEAYVVSEIRNKLKHLLPRAIFFKHYDAATSGIPDIAITYGGFTTYVEAKLLKDGESKSSFDKKIDRLQLATCRLLAREGRCYYFVGYPMEKILHGAIITPDSMGELVKHLGDKFELEKVTVRGIFNGFFDHAVSRLIWILKENADA